MYLQIRHEHILNLQVYSLKNKGLLVLERIVAWHAKGIHPVCWDGIIKPESHTLVTLRIQCHQR